MQNYADGIAQITSNIKIDKNYTIFAKLIVKNT